ncbi:MAG: hypothetical protein Q8P62_00580 [Candidatus Peregrinibacteria bacterium]|nr:hypothetical protein [Candidatus Peregrinibacteria bacterium]
MVEVNQISEVPKSRLFLKVSLILLIIFVSLFFVWKFRIGLFVKAKIEPVNESYKIGDVINIETTLSNFSPIPFSSLTCKDSPVYIVENKAAKKSGSLNFDDGIGCLEAEPVYIKPMEVKNNMATFRLVDDSLKDYYGSPWLRVAPGENEISIEWGDETTKLVINVIK